MAKQFHIITFGCQMNKSDSERICGFLENLGMDQASHPEEADLVIINTCMVRQMAEDRVYGCVKNFSELKKKKPSLVIGVTGCMPGQDKKGKYKKKMPGIDLYFTIDDLPKLGVRLGEMNFDVNNLDIAGGYLNIYPRHPNKHHAYIVTNIGCDKFCSYCIVPYARGRKIDRPVKSIIDEAKKFIGDGGIAITLLGQIVNDYQAPDPENFSAKNPFNNHFAKLLWEINQIPGIQRIFWTSPHPLYMDDEVIRALALPKQVNYLHLPIQAGSDRILEKMNRGYTGEYYLEIIEKIKKIRSGMAIGTDIIVGFSGETAEDFKQTVELYKRVDFDVAYVAMYSKRPGTAAAKQYEDDVTYQEKKERWQELENLMNKITLRKNRAFQDKKVRVLVEHFKDGYCWGHSGEMKLVKFPSDRDLTGGIESVIIKSPDIWCLEGERNKGKND